MTKLRVFVADDHVFIRAGLRSLIDAEPDMAVVGEAADGRDAVEKIAAAAPDVVLMDLSMPGCDGLETTRLVRAAQPGARVLALTMHEDRTNLRGMVAAGASGYLLKRAAASELIHAIRAVAQGGLFVDPRIAAKLVGVPVEETELPPGELSGRETEVLRWIARGYSHKEIAAQLEVSLKSVETYKTRAMEKLGLTGRVDVVRHAAAAGWLTAAAS